MPAFGALDVGGGSQNTYIQFNLSSIPAGYAGPNGAKATLKTLCERRAKEIKSKAWGTRQS